jgi:pimeloyl-ACP methyl ester carboxylesterase
VAPGAKVVVGMSLGGLTTIRLSATRPDLVPKAVVVDVTPGVGARQVGMTMLDRGAVAVMQGPPEYDSFDHMLAELAKTMPNRPPESLIPGLRHNSKRRDDGKWVWRHDLMGAARPGSPATPEGQEGGEGENRLAAFESLWDDLATIKQPILLVKGGASKFVHEDDASRFASLAGDARVQTVEGAGHSVQSDRPVQLASLIESHLAD